MPPSGPSAERRNTSARRQLPVSMRHRVARPKARRALPFPGEPGESNLSVQGEALPDEAGVTDTEVAGGAIKVPSGAIVTTGVEVFLTAAF